MREDKREGRKERFSGGRRIPAGTGSLRARFKELAAKRDEEYEELAAKQEAEAQAAIAAAAAADAEAANEGEVAEEAQLG